MRRFAIIMLGLVWAAPASAQVPERAVPRTVPVASKAASSVVVTNAEDLAKPYAAGTTILIPAGTVIQGPVVMKAVGTAEKPITLTRTGSGPAPRITGRSEMYSDALTVGSYTTVDGLLISDTNRYGVSAPKGTTGIVVRNSEIRAVGIGVGLLGTNGRVLGNVIHDLAMVKNTPKTVNADDDYGANGVLLAGSGHEVAHNRFTNNRAPSYDYGQDGGAVEIFGSLSSTRIHHNWAENCVGFIEAGTTGDVIEDVTIEFNVAVGLAEGTFLTPHNGNRAATFRNIVVRRNTIVALTAGPKAMGIFYLDGDPAPGAFSIADNIVSLNSGDSVFKRDGAYHTGNVFDLKDKATHLFNNWSMNLGPGETYADPMFVDAAKLDFRLRPGSPAAGKGAF